MTKLRGVIVEGTLATVFCLQVRLLAFSMLDAEPTHSRQAPLGIDHLLE